MLDSVVCDAGTSGSILMSFIGKVDTNWALHQRPPHKVDDFQLWKFLEGYALQPLHAKRSAGLPKGVQERTETGVRASPPTRQTCRNPESMFHGLEPSEMFSNIISRSEKRDYMRCDMKSDLNLSSPIDPEIP